ncbi:MAG: S8 family serine peptidase, partial [Bacteroidota bacterium]
MFFSRINLSSVLCLIAFSSMILTVCSLQAQSIDSLHLDGVVYVQLKPGASFDLVAYDSSNLILNQLIDVYEILEISQPFAGINDELDRSFRFDFASIAQIDNLLLQLQNHPELVYAEKSPLFRTNFIPDDLLGSQWHLPKIEAEKAWDLQRGNDDIVVAVVDNAVRMTHEDLSSILWINQTEANGLPGVDDDLNGYVDDVHGFDVADRDADPSPPDSLDDFDSFSHGTHVAGIAAAATDNQLGGASIGFGISMMSVKCTPSSESGNVLTNAYDGIVYAMRSGADVINMSFGSASNTYLTLGNILTAAHQQDIMLVTAAGNANTDTEFYPAAHPDVLAVAATNQSDRKPSFSNFGGWIDVAAPGQQIYAPLAGSDQSYGSLSGTSMAAPLVAGLCGLMRSQDATQTPDQLKTQLVNACENIDANHPEFAGQMGAGRINAFWAVGGTATNVVPDTDL